MTNITDLKVYSVNVNSVLLCVLFNKVSTISDAQLKETIYHR